MGIEKIKGWAIQAIPGGGVMDKGLRINIKLRGEDGQERDIFIPHDQIHILQIILLDLSRKAEVLRVELGLEDKERQLGVNLIDVEGVMVGSSEDGSEIVIRFQSVDQMSFPMKLPPVIAQTVVDGLSKALKKRSL